MSDAESKFAGIGTAHLSSELDSDGPYTISGVALGAGDVTVGSSGVKKKWPAEELKDAAGTLEGQPLVKDHENNTDGRVGTVTEAYYKDGVGVKYEAELAPHYEELAQDIAAGIQEVSARAYHDPVDELEEDDDTGALRTSNVVFDNLSVVSQGAAPSNTAEIGGLDVSSAVAMAQGPTGGAVATLSQGSPRPDATAELAKFSDGDWVKGDSSGGTWHGKVRDMKSDGCYSDEIDGDQEICAGDDEPVYLIENYDPESGEFTDTMVAHKEGSVSSWDHEENARKEHIDVMAAELESDESELDEVYSEWSDHVNMSASQLESWAEHPCSDKASKDPEAVRKRNMNLLETDKSDWGSDEIEDAKRTISFISRMSDEANEPDDPKSGGPDGCPSEWAISLLNWAYNPFDSMPDVPDEMEEENRHGPRARPDKSAMPKGEVDGTPEWEEGDMVRWQVEPDLFGKIVHVDDEKNVAMVEIMGMESGDMTSTGFTITAGFSDIKPMKVPESKADMSSKWKDDEGMSVPSEIEKAAVSELAEIGDMDVNGLVMFDDRMGAISGFEMQDGELMIELDVIERDDGSFQKTGDTVMRSLTDVDSMSTSEPQDTSVAELKSVAGVTFEDTSDGKLDQSEIPNDDYEQHYLFPDDENKSDSSYPVVDAEGNLRKGNVAAAHGLGARGGVSDSELKEKLMALNKEWPEGERPIDFEEDEMGAATPDDDAQSEPSTMTVAALSADSTSTTNNEHNSTMTEVHYNSATEDDIEEMSEPVVIEEDEIEELRAKADEADELSERLDKVNSSVEELANAQETLDGVDEDKLDELREYDEAVVLTDDEHEELQGLVDDIGGVFAEELAEYSAFEAEELQERFTPLELRDKVESHDEASIESELGESTEDPEPEGGSADPEELSESVEDAEAEATEEELREAVAEHLEDGQLYRQAEKVREGDIALDEMGIDVESVVAE
jgi:hypothetical protein